MEGLHYTACPDLSGANEIFPDSSGVKVPVQATRAGIWLKTINNHR